MVSQDESDAHGSNGTRWGIGTAKHSYGPEPWAPPCTAARSRMRMQRSPIPQKSREVGDIVRHSRVKAMTQGRSIFGQRMRTMFDNCVVEARPQMVSKLLTNSLGFRMSSCRGELRGL